MDLALCCLISDDLESFKRHIQSTRKHLNSPARFKELPTCLSVLGVRKICIQNICAYLGKLRFLQALARFGASFDILDEVYQGACLHWAVFGRHKKIAQWLVFEGDCSVFIHNRFEETPFQLVGNEDKEDWKFLAPNWLVISKAAKKEAGWLLNVFHRLVNSEAEGVGSSLDSFFAPLPIYETIRLRISQRKYSFFTREGVFLFLRHTRELFKEAAAFYKMNDELVAAIWRCKNVFSAFESVVSSGEAATALPPAPFSSQSFPMPVNFAIKVTSGTPISFIREDEHSIDYLEIFGTEGGHRLASSELLKSRSIVLPGGSYEIEARLTKHDCVPVLYADCSRLSCVALSGDVFRWTITQSVGHCCCELYLCFGKALDEKTKSVKSIGSNPHQIRQVFIHFFVFR